MTTGWDPGSASATTAPRRDAAGVQFGLVASTGQADRLDGNRLLAQTCGRTPGDEASAVGDPVLGGL